MLKSILGIKAIPAEIRATRIVGIAEQPVMFLVAKKTPRTART
jgi:hypothetical protein